MWEPKVYIPVSIVAFIICLAIAASTIYMILQKKKMKPNNRSLYNKSVDLEVQQLSLSARTVSQKISFESSSQKLSAVETFTVEEVITATANFCSSNHIGGKVFHGRHKGRNLAIKRTNHETVSKIKFELVNDMTHFHPHIIKLLGSCTASESDDAFLVFEYAENGSLKDWIHRGLAMKSQFISSCYCFLSWNQRVRISLDVATALQYMHKILNPSYVHRNITSRNIFLDEEFNAKIGKFGMEECVTYNYTPEEANDLSASSWDTWYIAPELKNSSSSGIGTITTSIDIYAFGVVLLEILTAKPPSGENKLEIILRSSDSTEKMKEWLDNVLGDDYSFDAVVTLANLAKACLVDDPLLRPNAGEIVEKLSILVAEFPEGNEEQFTVDESSCKPLVVKHICE